MFLCTRVFRGVLSQLNEMEALGKVAQGTQMFPLLPLF